MSYAEGFEAWCSDVQAMPGPEVGAREIGAEADAEISALRAENERLRELVSSAYHEAYHEGYDDGAKGRPLNPYKGWGRSDARALLRDGGEG